MTDLKVLMQEKTNTIKPSNENGVSLGQFISPYNGDLIELVALFRGNKKTGDLIQLSVLPVDGDIADKTSGRNAICGDCPHNKLGTCYAYDQGLFVMMKEFRQGNYKPMQLQEFLNITKGKLIRFGRFGDLSMLPFELVEAIAENSGGFTGYTNQWRSKFYDKRFNSLFMISTLGEKDTLKAQTMHEGARIFKVIHTDQEYKNSIENGVITCPSENGFQCSDCLLCDGGNSKVSTVDIEIKAHGLTYKSTRINKLLKSDLIAINNI